MDINITLNINNPENLDMNELCEKIKQRIQGTIEKQNPTGYERAKKGYTYYFEESGHADALVECGDDADNDFFNSANYYSDRILAENNARADALMRRLRRFAVLHRERPIEWEHSLNYKIAYNHNRRDFVVDYNDSFQGVGVAYFDSKETALQAIEEFKDELIWYFTEYKDSL